MDSEKYARRSARRVILSEILMVIAVVVTVTILALLVSGYWLGSDFKVERQGMLQISSLPTGANIEVDGESYSWLQRTNTSKVVPAGEHTIVLTKDGYDSWTKTVNVNEGIFYRLHYPRLFLKNREPEIVLDTKDYASASISPNRNWLLLMNNTTNWGLINLDGDKPTVKPLDISKTFSSVSLAEGATSGLFTGTVKSLNWAKDNEHILFEIETGSGREWVILNIKNPNEKVNLTREFAANFTEVKILNDSTSSLLVVINGNLHRLDVGSRQLSAALVKKIGSFHVLDSNLIFSAEISDEVAAELEAKTAAEDGTAVAELEPTEPETAEKYYVGMLKLGENKITPLLATKNPTKPVVSRFYDEEFLAILEDKTVTLYKKQDFQSVATYNLTFAPEKIRVGHNGEFITLSTAGSLATLDMESSSLREWSVEANEFYWLDDDMIYAIANGNLKVFDYDGFNPRELAHNVSSHFPVTITADKWLYYFSDDNLVRELIRN